MKISYDKKTICYGVLTALITFVVTSTIYGYEMSIETVILSLFSILLGLTVAVRPEFSNRSKKFALYGIFVFAVLFWGSLCITSNLWYDEGYTAALVQYDLPTMFDITSKDVHSPLYYIIAKCFYHICGNSFQGLKICSLVFMILYLLLGLFPIRKEFGNRVSFFFLFFSLTFPCMTVHATDARMYTMALFSLTLTGILAVKIYRKFTVTGWIMFFLASVFSVYIHTFTMLSTVIIYLMLLAALIINKKGAKQLITFFTNAVLVSVSYLPWITVLWNQFNTRTETAEALTKMTMYDFMDFLAEWFSSFENPRVIAIVFGAALFFTLTYFFIQKKDSKIPATLGLTVFVLTTVIGIFLSVKVVPCYLGRYSFPAFGFVILFLAIGMSYIKNPKVVLAIMLTAFTVCLMNYKTELKLDFDRGLDEYNAFMDANSTPMDAIIYEGQHAQYLSIYRSDYTNLIYGFKSPLNPFHDSVAFNDYSQLEEVLGNIWVITLNPDNMPSFEPYYSSAQKFQFHFMYYDFFIYKLTPVESTP